LTGTEIATRLSYLLWGTTPNVTLLRLGETGELAKPEVLLQELNRLLEDPRSEDGLGAFFVYWLTLDSIYDKSKSGRWQTFFAGTVMASMLIEIRHLGVAAIRRGDALAQLLTSREAYVDASLAQVYGLPPPPTGGFTPVSLDGDRRAGITTRAAFLSTHGYPGDSAPIRRGKQVRMRLLCQVLPPPPANALVNLPAVRNTATPRESASTLTAAATCRAATRS
jgi:hypothetical protein